MDAPIVADIYKIMVDSVSLLGPDRTCYGDPVSFAAWSRGHGDYLWSTGDTTMDVYMQLDSSRWISVNFTDQNGCETSDSVYVAVGHPQVSLSEIPENICTNAVPIDLTGFISDITPPDGSLYFSGPDISNNNITHLNEGPYTATLAFQDANGCSFFDTIGFNAVSPEEISLNVPAIMFLDSSYVLDIPYENGTLYFNSTVVSNDNGYTIRPDQFGVGTYSLRYETELGDYGCLSEFEATVEIRDRSGIADIDTYGIRLYPIPTRGTLHVESESQYSSIQILDVNGRVLMQTTPQGERSSLDVSALCNGIYFIRLVSESGCFTKKFVKR